MLLLVGLGNPGSNYTNTRHNIGFKIIDAINMHFKLSKQKPKFKGLLTTGNIESKKIYADACIINQPLNFYSNWRAKTDLNSYFIKNNIPCLYGVDTRCLTKKLANEGAKKVALVNFGEKKESLDLLKEKINNWSGLENLDLAEVVSTNDSYNWVHGLWSKKEFNKN